MYRILTLIAALIISSAAQAQQVETSDTTLPDKIRKNELGIDINFIVSAMMNPVGDFGASYAQHELIYKRDMGKFWGTASFNYQEQSQSPIFLYRPPIFSSNDTSFPLGYVNFYSRDFIGKIGYEKRNVVSDDVDFIFAVHFVGSKSTQTDGVYEKDFQNDTLLIFDLERDYSDRVVQENEMDLIGFGASLTGGFRVNVLKRFYVVWEAKATGIYSFGTVKVKSPIAPTISNSVSSTSFDMLAANFRVFYNF